MEEYRDFGELTELCDYQDEHTDEMAGVNYEGFIIDNDTRADWAIRRIAEHERERDRLNRVRQERIEMLQRAIDRENENCERNVAGLRSMLMDYFQECDASITKTQMTYKLPSGRLVWKLPRVTYTHDDAAIIEHLRQTPDFDTYTETTTKLRWGELKKRLAPSGDDAIDRETGEIIPGIEVGYTEPEFVVKAE